MRTLGQIAFLLSLLNLNGQSYNDRKPHVTDSENELVLQRAHSIYDSNLIMMFSNNCMDSKRHIVYTLGIKKKGFQINKWEFRYKYIGADLYNRKLKVSTVKPSPTDIIKFREMLGQYGFWSLNTDSINDSRHYENGAEYVFFPNINCTDLFIFVDGVSKITLSATDVEEINKRISSRQREIFIRCRNAFLKLVK